MPVTTNSVDSSYYYVYQGDEQVGRHSLETKAMETAFNVSEACKCLVIVRQDKRVEVIYTPFEPEPEKNLPVIEVTWSRPLLKTDGSPLTENEIEGYLVKHIQVNGEEIHEAGNVYTYALTVEPGVHSFQIATKAYGMESEYSIPVSVTTRED